MWLLRIIVFALVLIPLFGHLEKLPLRQYDEARQAINALEMVQRGHPLVTYYDGAPETWNTKPPLLIWMQASLMVLLGPGELAVRLPSALAALLTCGLLWFFAKRYLRNEWIGLLAGLILVTAAGYVRMHGTRTGDFDVLLALTTTAASLSIFLWVNEKRNRWLMLFFGAITLGVLTKGIAALLFGPAWLLFVLLSGKLPVLLTNRYTYIGAAALMCFGIGYYALRNQLQPGFLQAVFQNELGGRYAQTTEGHAHDFWYYFRLLASDHFFPWLYLLPLGLLLIWKTRFTALRQLWLYLLLLVVAHLLVISASGTKLEWYMMPEYPLFALMIAISLYLIYDEIMVRRSGPKVLSAIVIAFALGVLFWSPYERILQSTYKPAEQSWDESNYAVCYFLRDAIDGKRTLTANKLAHYGYDAHARFYVMLCREKGINLEMSRWENLSPGDIIVVCHDEVAAYIEQHYHCTVTETYKNVKTFAIHGNASNNY
jgi:4-amino-4-deoxy-L-arabinose transferase-like glycosyltransferase